MTIKSILTHIDIDATPELRISFVRDLADRLDADLSCCSAARPVLPATTALSTISATNFYQDEAAVIDARHRILHEHLMRHAPFRNHVSWQAAIADPTDFIVQQGRAADLLVLYEPDLGQASDHSRTIDRGMVLLAAGRPVLLASKSMTPLEGRFAVVAWKDTREARRALADATPLLRHAEDVIILSIGRKDEVDGIDDVARHLARHGVRARSVIEPRGRRDIASSIIDFTRELGGDLIVAGGYGHSRFREWVFGGVTHSLLRETSVNRFLSN